VGPWKFRETLNFTGRNTLVKHVYVADNRYGMSGMLTLILGDLQHNLIQLNNSRAIRFTESVRTRRVDHEIFVQFEPIGSILGNDQEVIIAYRSENSARYGYGLYDETINLCKPLQPVDVIEKMAPDKRRLRIEERDQLARMLEILSKPRP